MYLFIHACNRLSSYNTEALKSFHCSNFWHHCPDFTHRRVGWISNSLFPTRTILILLWRCATVWCLKWLLNYDFNVFCPSKSQESVCFLIIMFELEKDSYSYICMCKLFCPEASPFLDMHYHCSTYLSLLDKRREWGQARIQRGARGPAPLSDHTTIIKFSGPMLKYFLHSFTIVK